MICYRTLETANNMKTKGYQVSQSLTVIRRGDAVLHPPVLGVVEGPEGVVPQPALGHHAGRPAGEQREVGALVEGVAAWLGGDAGGGRDTRRVGLRPESSHTHK